MSKTMRTGTIRYNITDRGRKYVGQARQFDVAKVVAIINGGAVQELVNKGDMFGYLGHGVRADFGLLPDESVVTPTKDGGTQFTPIDPCCRTVRIKAYPDGTIEHEAEFIDNKLGHTAWEWFQNKIGGFPAYLHRQWKTPPCFTVLTMCVCPILTAIVAMSWTVPYLKLIRAGLLHARKHC